MAHQDPHSDPPTRRADPTQASKRGVAARRDLRRELGTHGEELALEYLQARGFQLLARNHRTRHGEIDLIISSDRLLVFVEVKTRQVSSVRARRTRGHEDAAYASAGAPVPLEGLRHAQRARLRRLAAAWLCEVAPRPRPTELRFDAIGVILDGRLTLQRLDHIEGAW